MGDGGSNKIKTKHEMQHSVMGNKTGSKPKLDYHRVKLGITINLIFKISKYQGASKDKSG